MLGLRSEQVDLLSREIRLSHDTKTGEPRLVSMTGEVYQLMVECVRGKKSNDRVLTWDGEPEGEINPDSTKFRDEWEALVTASGLPNLLRHDFRRAGVRNLIRAGVGEKVAMKISGHKTRSMLDRYNIVDTADIVEASRKLEQARAAAVKTDTELTHSVYERN